MPQFPEIGTALSKSTPRDITELMEDAGTMETSQTESQLMDSLPELDATVGNIRGQAADVRVNGFGLTVIFSAYGGFYTFVMRFFSARAMLIQSIPKS